MNHADFGSGDSRTRRSRRERLALGADSGPWEYVVCNEAGLPYHPQVLSRYWREAVKAAGIRPIKLHGARHSCATLMHLQGVPGGDRRVDRPQGRQPHNAAVRALAGRGAESCRGDFESGCDILVTPSGLFEHLRTALALVGSGADDGNRTRVFSLGSNF